MVRRVSAILGGLAALSLSACGDEMTGESQTQAAPEPEILESEAAPGALDLAAEQACDAGDEAIMEAIPAGASFASRGADGMVVVACRLDDLSGVYRIDSTALPDGVRTEFDLAIAEHMRHGLRVGDDRSGTGAYRKRDGGFCAVQTDPQVSRAVCEAARQAAPLAAGEN